MHNTRSSALYGPSDYDHHLCLKPPLLVWVAVLYLARAVTMPFAIGIGHFAGINTDAFAAIKGLWKIDDALFPSLIALALLYALFRRLPGASRPVRWIWAHGVWILAAAASLDLLLSLVRAMTHDTQDLWPAIGAGIDLYFLLYILAARRVRDTFAEFPAPEAVGV